MGTPTRRHVLTGGAALAAISSWPVAAQLADPIRPAERAALEQEAEGFLARYAAPGLSVAIAWRGRIAYQQGFGFADRERGEAATPAHLFRIASVSKPITSVAAFTLIEQGRLRLTDRVFGGGAVLGADYGPTSDRRHVEDITVDHLLTHRIGGWRNDASDPMFANRSMDHAELIAWTLRNLPLTDGPGRRFGYSNFGYCLLGRIIEKIAGRPYAAYVQESVLQRCGVTDMRIAGNARSERAAREVVYYDQDGRDPYALNVARMDAHGGWLANAPDLVRFALHVDGFSNPPDILSRATIATMTAPPTESDRYARGWSVNRSNNWWHTGSLAGTRTILVRTARGLCWAALANTRRRDGEFAGALDRLMWTMVGRVAAWRG